jgi:uncharacterized protein (TIGR03118 family)
MRRARAAIGSLLGICCLVVLPSCGGSTGSGGGGSGAAGSSMTPSSIKVTATPASVSLGQSATITWSASSGTACTASGAWSGSEPASGTATVTPTSAGTATYTLSCSGGAYSSSMASATLAVAAASAYSLTNLVADAAGGTALGVDPNLVNPWGLAIPAGDPAWVADNHTETSTLYDGNGKAQPQPAANQLVVHFAAGAGGVTFDPTGIVFNASTTDFVLTAGGKSAAAAFIYSGEGGMIAGWSGSVDLTQAVTVYADAGGAVYKGLAIATNGAATYLYATDFHNNKIDVFNNTFTKQATSATSFSFSDPSIPAGFAPFGIQAINNGTSGAAQLYVTYAKQQAPDNLDNASGAGLGYVDIYDTSGKLIKQLVAAGALNAPWGLALAPADFGTFSNALLVGNFGDGRINAYDPASGTLLGSLGSASNTPLAFPGLWGIAFGNDVDNQPHNTLFFTAGPNNQANGAFGRIDLGATAPVLNAPPVVTLTAPTGSLKGAVTLSAKVIDPIAIAKVDFLVNSKLIGTATAAPDSVIWDTTTIADGQATVVARATDVDGNVGSSSPVTVTVANNSAPAPAPAPAPAQVPLSQLQAQIFTPICSGCHSGFGTSLPGVQNLTAGNTFSNVVNVASIEQPALKRIAPNDPTNSYLIQKIEGAAGITGSRMPFGCGSSSDPCLDQATIDLVISWANQGALNN